MSLPNIYRLKIIYRYIVCDNVIINSSDIFDASADVNMVENKTVKTHKLNQLLSRHTERTKQKQKLSCNNNK